MTTERDRIQHNITAEAQAITKTTVIDLDAFLALSSDDRAARWRQWDRAAKFQACALQLERKQGDWTPDQVEQAILHYDRKWGPEPRSDLPIPPIPEILEVVVDTIADARRHQDWQGVRQFDRIRANILGGAKLAWHHGDLLITSLNNPGAVYSVNARGCSCPNGAAGKASCWHIALHDTLLDMRETAAVSADIEADRNAAAALGRRLATARVPYLEAA